MLQRTYGFGRNKPERNTSCERWMSSILRYAAEDGDGSHSAICQRIAIVSSLYVTKDDSIYTLFIHHHP